MWKDVRKMSREEIAEELDALKRVRELSNKVNVDKLLNQDLDLDPLRKVNLTITANGALYRRVKGILPELMEKIYKDRTIYKKKMLAENKIMKKLQRSHWRKKLHGATTSRWHERFNSTLLMVPLVISILGIINLQMLKQLLSRVRFPFVGLRTR